MRVQYRKAVKKKIAKGVVFESLAPYILKVLLTLLLMKTHHMLIPL